jgi:dihydrofolate reductase
MRLTVTSHLTLDGVVQSNGKPEPELGDGFEQGGWQVPYFDDDLAGFAADWIAAADAFLLGRRTYELFEGHWSLITDPGDPLAARLNGLPKYVVSGTLDPATASPSTPTSRWADRNTAPPASGRKAMSSRAPARHGLPGRPDRNTSVAVAAQIRARSVGSPAT